MTFEPFEDDEEIAELILQLEDPDPSIRRVAVMGLADTAETAGAIIHH